MLNVIKLFASLSYFITLQALASTLNEEELANLRDQFDAIDVDKSGAISLEEMRHVLMNFFLTCLNLSNFNLFCND